MKFIVLGEQFLGPLEKHFSNALTALGIENKFINVTTIPSNITTKISNYTNFIPKLGKRTFYNWEKSINTEILKQIKCYKPDIIFSYNESRMFPETVSEIKKNKIKFVMYLADDPNWIESRPNFLLDVCYADLTIVPDTGFIDGLNMIGVKNICFQPLGAPLDEFYPIIPDENELHKFKSEVLFVGRGYGLTRDGIRRSILLSYLKEFDLKIYGVQWEKIFKYFPELKIHYRGGSLSLKDLNIAMNCTKIYPVLVNSGIKNGISTRIFDTLASGTFVLAEYRKDIKKVFPEGIIPMFKNGDELSEMTKHFLNNESERMEKAKKASLFVREKWDIKKNAAEIVSIIIEKLYR